MDQTEKKNKKNILDKLGLVQLIDAIKMERNIAIDLSLTCDWSMHV